MKPRGTMRVTLVGPALVSLTLGACERGAARPEPGPAGLWASEGYGYVFEIAGDTLETFEVTSISCLPSYKAGAVPPPAGALGAFRLTEAPLTLLVLPDTGSDAGSGRGRIHANGTASDIVVRRIERKPSPCDRPTPNTPLSNFDVFTETWTEHYPFFAEKRVDWPAVVGVNRARVTDSTPPAELFTVLEGMIAPMEDAHTLLVSDSLSRRFSGSRKTGSWLERDDWSKGYALSERHFDAPLHRFCEGQLEFGMLRPEIGYLRIRSFGRYHADGSFESGLTALEAALDTIFSGAGQWKGLVIDVRLNGGGADPYGLAIASRLTGREYVAYAKQARSDPADPTAWTAEQPSLVRPSTRPGFQGPVVELIGVQSISAAETFTQALLGRRPAVVRVGEPTQGVFSDVLVRRLPNGWRFGLPNERFVSDGKSYDGPGIPPDVPVTSFTPAGLRSGRDAGLERAVELLQQGG